MKKYFVFLLGCFFSFSAIAGDKELLRQVFEIINNKYIDEVNLSDIVSPGLKALSKEDKNIRIASEKNTTTIYYKGRLQKIYAHPQQGNDADKWADSVVNVFEGAKQISPDIHRQDFELVEVFLYEGIKAFDKNSHYSPILDIGQEFIKPQPYLASLHDDNILYLRLGTINERTVKDFNETMEKYQNLQGIILDLRGNKGGYLKYALQITDMFLSEGVMIYTTGRNKGKRNVYSATEGKLYAQAPMVILVDGHTASSAEVIAMVLQEKNRAILVGSQTYGKNSVQNVYELNNGAYLALTTERFYSDKNVSVEETSGIRPDICTSKGETADVLNQSQAPNDDRFCPRAFNQPNKDIEIAETLIKKQLSSKIEK